MNMHSKFSAGYPRRSRGVSLIELMVAITIASLLALGLIQIFGASRASSQMQEGLSRVQENGRLATQFLQRQVRMVGFMGCGADTGRFVQESFVNHFAQFDGTLDNDTYRFQRPIQAFTVGVGTVPTELADGLSGTFAPGNDVLILRVLSEESVPVVSVVKTGNNLSALVGSSNSEFLPAPADPAVLAIQNCRTADVFAATVDAGSNVLVDGASTPNVYLDPTCGNCAWSFQISNATLNAQPLVGVASLNAEVHRGEYIAMYVRNNAAGIPSLYMRRLERNSIALGAAEEFIEGVENMQLRFGYDADGDGEVDEYRTAADVSGAAVGLDLDNNWRNVLSVRVGLLVRSPDVAGVGLNDDGDPRSYDVLGQTVTPANDGAMRQVYETTIALRNRLFNS